MKFLPSIFLTLFAACAFAQIPSTAPPGENPNFASAHRLMQTGKYDDAIAELRGLQAKSPPPAGLDRELGVVYYRKGDFLNAIESFKKATAENSGDNESVQLLGIVYYMAGKPALAIPLLEKVQSWMPAANVDASYLLGVCYLQTENFDKARHAFATMFSVPSDSAASYLFTARMLLRQQFDPKAEEYARKAASLDPSLPGPHFLIGEIDLAKGDFNGAIQEFESELKVNPAYAAAYYKLADAYSRVQKFDDAEKLLQRSIWLDATSTGPYILMGKVLAKKGEPELAARSLERALAMDPKNSMTHYLLGQAYRDLGRKEDATAEFKLAEQLKSSGQDR